ncbi:hypothetical protein OOU_Y34scaffold00528g29 [Pyricularia oryzae Y34]|uniref:Uncharacterized protein n=2 Tax=Pyricularia oryzae TaxID=318829 RepID=A0AA97PL82_PYRO3|nr:hypothetical protein OOU_Y34scaffold00528g29 [Pyricularia oryzae Y34]
MFGSDYSCCARKRSNRASTALRVGRVLGVDGLKYGFRAVFFVFKFQGWRLLQLFGPRTTYFRRRWRLFVRLEWSLDGYEQIPKLSPQEGGVFHCVRSQSLKALSALVRCHSWGFSPQTPGTASLANSSSNGPDDAADGLRRGLVLAALALS